MLKQEKKMKKIQRKMEKLNSLFAKLDTEEFLNFIERNKIELQKNVKSNMDELDTIQKKQESIYKSLFDSIQRKTNNVSRDALNSLI